MCVDSSTELSSSLLLSPASNFAFTPTIDLTLEPNADLAKVFSPPHPQAVAKEPLSSTQLSVSEERQVRDALLETIVKCMEIQNSLYRLVLLKLQTHVTAAAAAAAAAVVVGLTDADSQPSEASDLPSTLTSKENDADSQLSRASDLPNVPSAENVGNALGSHHMESTTESLNNAPEASSMKRLGSTSRTCSSDCSDVSLNDDPEAPSKENADLSLNNVPNNPTMESLDKTPVVDSVDDTGAALNDAPQAPNTEGSREIFNDAPRALLCELKAPLEALMRCADIQRELFQRLVTVNLTTTEEATDVSGKI